MRKDESKKTYTGINIQYPISQVILSGEKTVETRTYPIPKKYVGQEMLLIETGGKVSKFKARAVAVIRFGESFKYQSESDFYDDFKRHRVDSESPWAWDLSRGKWGWPVEVIRILSNPTIPKKRLGIKFTCGLEI